MISFIVIGRNEGWKLTKCFSSIFKTIEQYSLTAYEVIYVDSKSTDDSIGIAKEFKFMKTLQLTGDCNAAIARNVGAEESKGEVLFFIDGDMELLADFLPQVYSEENGLVHDFVSGNWENHYYSQDNKFLQKEIYLKIDKDRFEKVTGGLFLINRSKWEMVAGMNSSFRISQDIDLGLRLASKGVFLYRKKSIAAKHHTISYLDKNRIWEDFFSLNHLYARSLLYRKHFYNKHMYSRLFYNDYSLLVLIFSFLLLPFFNWGTLIIIYLLIIGYKSYNKRKKIELELINTFFFLLLRDITVFAGFFFFWPIKKQKVRFINIH